MTVLRVKGRVAVLLFGLLAAASGLLAFGVFRPDATTTGDGVARILEQDFEACAGEPPCLSERAARLVPSVGLPSVVEAAAELYGREPFLQPPCHTYMHVLGEFVAPGFLSGEPAPLDEFWPFCDAGLVHGAFDHIELDASSGRAPGDLVALCYSMREHLLSVGLEACFHGIGHSIGSVFRDDVEAGKKVCLEAASAAEESFQPCVSGVIMAVALGTFANPSGFAGPIPTTPDGWASAFPECSAEDVRGNCVSSYGALAANGDPPSVRSYLEWCVAMTPEGPAGSLGQPGNCAYVLGKNLTILEVREVLGEGQPRQGESGYVTCLEAVDELGFPYEEFCTKGAVEALVGMNLDDQEVEALICRLLDGSRFACKES